MDNYESIFGRQRDTTVENLYNEGYRACESFDGSAVYLKDGVYHCHSNRSPDWHALRAYQDEQRKKGEQIYLAGDGAGTDPYWYDRCYVVKPKEESEKPDTAFDFDVITVSGNPVIYVTPAAGGGKIRGRFTNFRWRPGHGPKRSPGINDLRNDTPIGEVNVTMQDLIDREKGGSNG